MLLYRVSLCCSGCDDARSRSVVNEVQNVSYGSSECFVHCQFIYTRMNDFFHFVSLTTTSIFKYCCFHCFKNCCYCFHCFKYCEEAAIRGGSRPMSAIFPCGLLLRPATCFGSSISQSSSAVVRRSGRGLGLPGIAYEFLQTWRYKLQLYKYSLTDWVWYL